MLRRALPYVVVLALLLSGDVAAFGAAARAVSAADGIHKIEHVVIIMQENRSFDSYFGTYPGADGIRDARRRPASLRSRLGDQGVRAPVPRPERRKHGRPHSAKAADLAIDGGKMDGFIAVMHATNRTGGCPTDIPTCIVKGHEKSVMGYHTQAEIPDYWAYARNFVLQDRMFAPVRSWSLPTHLYMVSEWAASCAKIGDPASCKPERTVFQRRRSPAGSLRRRRLRSAPGAPTTRGPISPIFSTPTTSPGRTT